MGIRQSVGIVVCAFALGGCLSDGKFYSFSTQPSASYPDAHRGSGEFTDGTDLTDGKTAPAEWTMASHKPLWVGWTHGSLPGGYADITVDLGKVYTIKDIDVHAGHKDPGAIRYPQSVQIFPGQIASGTPYATLTYPIGQPSSATAAWSGVTDEEAGPLSARYLTFRAHAQPGYWLFLDEIRVDGPVPANPKFLPPAGKVYHGAFDPQPFDLPNFEASAGKGLASILWYESFQLSYQVGVQSFVNNYVGDNRILQLGWEPWGLPVCGCGPGACQCGALDSILNALDGLPNQGNRGQAYYDDYFKGWLTQAKNHGKRIFLRFASEMNLGPGASWSGAANGANADAALKYKRVWWRLYNVAEQVGATNVAFVWSPAEYLDSYPGQSWNDFTSYYPGPQYVDWVGMNGPYYDLAPLPQDFVGRVSPIYDTYKNGKPIMLSEMGACDSNMVEFVNDAFNAMKATFTGIRAFYWFNAPIGACDGTIQGSPSGLAAYQSKIADARYVGSAP